MTPVGNDGKVNRINAFSSSRKGRLIWLFAAASFLALTVFALLVAVRTRADDGLGTGWWEHHIGEGGTAAETLPESVVEGIPAALYPAYPSPFRPLPEGEDTEAATEPVTETEAATEGEEIVYHSRHNDRMEIALSFDDGPHPRLTPVILEILEEYGIKATFFMVGENVGYYPAAAKKRILDNIHNGAVILLHPTSATNAAILGDVLRELKAMGYRFGSLDELTGGEGS